MPPDGYDTVTLPEELVAEIDAHAEAIGARSRAAAIQSLFDGFDSRVSAHVVDVEGDVAGDIADRVGSPGPVTLEATEYRKIADEVAGVLQQ